MVFLLDQSIRQGNLHKACFFIERNCVRENTLANSSSAASFRASKQWAVVDCTSRNPKRSV